MKVAPGLLLVLIATAPVAAQSAAIPSQPAGPMAEAYVRRMQSDLRNLLSAQEIHYSRHMTYAGPAADVNTVEALAFHSSQDVRVRIVSGNERGWSGVASSESLPGRGCAVFVGNAEAPTTPGGLAVEVPGVVTCDRGVSSGPHPVRSDAIVAMTADLKNLMSSQEAHYSTAMTYTDDLAALGVVPSEGVTIRATAASDRGHAATATNGSIGCAVFVGNATPPRTAGGRLPTEQGVVICD